VAGAQNAAPYITENSMVVSIKSNSSALIALQQLNAVNKELDSVQERIASGYRINEAKDGASSYAVAQKQRAEKDGYDAVDQSVQRGINILDVSIRALETLSNLLIEMKTKAVQASNPALSATDRQLIDTSYQSYVAQISTVINAATYDNFNLIDKNPVTPATDDLRIISEPTASAANAIVIPAINIKASTSDMLGDLSSLANATAESTAIDAMQQAVNSALATLGASNSRLETHSGFVKKLQDSLSLGIGKLVDADLGFESARLRALQVQQQLSSQALQIANSRPQQILSLFG
jgi:flagellin